MGTREEEAQRPAYPWRVHKPERHSAAPGRVPERAAQHGGHGEAPRWLCAQHTGRDGPAHFAFSFRFTGSKSKEQFCSLPQLLFARAITCLSLNLVIVAAPQNMCSLT